MRWSRGPLVAGGRRHGIRKPVLVLNNEVHSLRFSALINALARAQFGSCGARQYP
jgi:hypothetical protein